MELKVKKLAEKSTNTTKLACNLLKALEERKQMLFENGTMTTAIFLDPRFKCSVEKFPEKLLLAKQSVVEVWEKIKKLKDNEKAQPTCPNHSETNLKKRRGGRNEFIDSSDESDEETDEAILNSFFSEQGTASSISITTDQNQSNAEILSQIEDF